MEGDNTQFDANPYSAELLTLEPADGSAAMHSKSIRSPMLIRRLVPYSFQFVSTNFNGVLGHIAMHALSPNLNVSLRSNELVSRWALQCVKSDGSVRTKKTCCLFTVLQLRSGVVTKLQDNDTFLFEITSTNWMCKFC